MFHKPLRETFPVYVQLIWHDSDGHWWLHQMLVFVHLLALWFVKVIDDR